MFVAVTRLTLPPQAMDHVAEAFRRSAPALQQFPGFLGFELWRRGDRLEAISRWESRAAMEQYVHSDLFRAHHAGASTGQDAETAQYDAEVVVSS